MKLRWRRAGFALLILASAPALAAPAILKTSAPETTSARFIGIGFEVEFPDAESCRKGVREAFESYWDPTTEYPKILGENVAGICRQQTKVSLSISFRPENVEACISQLARVQQIGNARLVVGSLKEETLTPAKACAHFFGLPPMTECHIVLQGGRGTSFMAGMTKERCREICAKEYGPKADACLWAENGSKLGSVK